MSSFGPDSTWASPRPSLRLLAVLLAAFALAFALTPAASAQEADPASAGEPAAAPDASSDPTPVPESPPIPEPPPPPEPAPSPEPAASTPDPPPAIEPVPSAPDHSAATGRARHRRACGPAPPTSRRPRPSHRQQRRRPRRSMLPIRRPPPARRWAGTSTTMRCSPRRSTATAGPAAFAAGAPAVFRGLRALGQIAPRRRARQAPRRGPRVPRGARAGRRLGSRADPDPVRASRSVCSARPAARAPVWRS